MKETQIQSPGQEDPLEKEMATHSSILGWDISRTEEPGGLQSMELQRVRHDLVTKLNNKKNPIKHLYNLKRQLPMIASLISYPFWGNYFNTVIICFSI